MSKAKRLKQLELLKALPSFKERTAFVDSLKRRWRQQKGYCSVFDKARMIKSSMERGQFKTI